MTKSVSLQDYIYTDDKAQHHHAYIVEPLLSLLNQKFSSQQQSPYVLDLGCGNGSLSRVIAAQGYRVIGIEPSTTGIQFAPELNVDCRFIQASIEDLPYTELENQFDGVVSTEVIEHLLYPRELVRAAKRCLKPGGCLVLTTPYHGYWKNLAIALMGKMDQHFTSLWDGGHVKFFSPKTLGQLMEEEGLSQIEFKFAGRYPYFWKSMICCAIKT